MPDTETVGAFTPAELAVTAAGFCGVHAGWALVQRHRIPGGRRTYYGGGVTDPAVACPHPEHTDADRERCTWCGGPLYVGTVPPYWQRSGRKSTCGDLCRLRKSRAERRARAIR